MGRDIGSDWGVPYYNKPKPPGYIVEMYKARLAVIDDKIKVLEEEKAHLIKKINEQDSTVNTSTKHRRK